jgi:hypothetical protein
MTGAGLEWRKKTHHKTNGTRFEQWDRKGRSGFSRPLTYRANPGEGRKGPNTLIICRLRKGGQK